MGSNLIDLFKAETEFDVKASEMYGLMKEAVKAEFLLNAAKCDVPHTYTRQIATGEKEDAPFMVGIDLGSGSVGIIRKHEQRVEWIDIQDIIRKGRAGVSLPPGTEINFTLKNGDPASVVVVGVDHYEKGDCVFWFRRIVDRHCMNSNNTNRSGFSDSDMQKYLNDDVFALLPDELQSVIAVHKKVQKVKGKSVEAEGRLFLMSIHEGRGWSNWPEYNGTDKQFPFFEERQNRIAHDEGGDPVRHWTADPSNTDATKFCYFSERGYSNTANASDDSGVAPLFVIK